VKISTTITVEVDPKVWQEVAGVDARDVRRDVRTYVEDQVRQASMITEAEAEVTAR
jgi:hypothetical protein